MPVGQVEGWRGSAGRAMSRRFAAPRGQPFGQHRVGARDQDHRSPGNTCQAAAAARPRLPLKITSRPSASVDLRLRDAVAQAVRLPVQREVARGLAARELLLR